MAWHAAGAWTDLHKNAIRNIITEVCFAVNEREAVLGLTESKWEIGDGTPMTKARPIYADFDDTPLAAANSVIRQDLLLLQTAIDTLASTSGDVAFVESDSDFDLMTDTATLLGKGSYGTTWLTVADARITDVKLYLQVREALDDLIYVRWNIDNSFPATASQRRGGSDTDKEVSWDDAVADTKTNSSATPLLWQGSNTSGTFASTIGDTLAWADWESAATQGLLIKGYYVYRIQGAKMGIGISMSDSNFTETISASSDRDDVVEKDRGTSWPNIGSDTPADEPGFDTVEPSDWPFDNLANGEVAFSAWTPVFVSMGGPPVSGENFTRCYTELRPGTELTYG